TLRNPGRSKEPSPLARRLAYPRQNKGRHQIEFPRTLSRLFGVLGPKEEVRMDRKRNDNDRPTEDDLAQAALAGPKANPSLQPAPLTRKEEEQMPPVEDPGHVA